MTYHYHPKGIHTANMPVPDRAVRVQSLLSVRPFITIAPQVGAESASLPHRLAEALDERDPKSPAWSHWDQELIEKVSADSHVPTELVASLDSSGHWWVDDLLGGVAGRPDETFIFNRLKKTVRGLARSGNVILVGHGSTLMTRDLPGGTHLRLIAPNDFRVNKLAERLGVPVREAAKYLRRLERQRKAFFARFWPGRPLSPEIFTAVFNVAKLDETRLLHGILGILHKS